MHHSSLPSSADPSASASFYLVLGNWLDAVSAFQENYHLLNHYLFACEPGSEQLSRFVSQCSTSQVTDLLAKMCYELKALLGELDHPTSLSSLTNHTARLNFLTNQAAVLISLLNQSSC